MPSETPEPSRRFRPVGDLTLFELAPLLGAGTSAAQVKQATAALGDGFALERSEDDRWLVVGWTGTSARAQAWVDFLADPEPLPPST